MLELYQSLKEQQLDWFKNANGLVSLNIPGQVDTVCANGNDALKQDTFTLSDTSGCHTENIFGNVHSSKLKQVTPDKLNLVTPDKLKSVTPDNWTSGGHTSLMSPDVTDMVKVHDSKAGAGDFKTCQFMEIKESVQHSPVIPEHIVPVLENAKEHLTAPQLQELTQLLCDFQDVFAKDEFDMGNFTAIKNSIDMGQAKPVKERMRWKPTCFAGEKEAHLKKMLTVGVIQPSVSDWASAPVLIRKKDGNVRWCIHYRGLNSVTEKDVFHCHSWMTAWTPWQETNGSQN